jgi:hypothetical protein
VAKYGSPSVVVSFGGTAITQHVQEINGVDIESLMEESHSFGDTWFESLATGMKKGSDVVLSGLYDDTATTGPDALFVTTAAGPSTAGTALVITYGGSKTTTYSVFIVKYSRMLSRGKLHRYSVTLRPTGAITEA